MRPSPLGLDRGATAASMSDLPAIGTFAWIWPVLGSKTSAERVDCRRCVVRR